MRPLGAVAFGLVVNYYRPAVEEFALPRQDGDRSERGVSDSPTLNLLRSSRSEGARPMVLS